MHAVLCKANDRDAVLDTGAIHDEAATADVNQNCRCLQEDEEKEEEEEENKITVNRLILMVAG